MSDERDLPPPPSYDSVVGPGGNVAAPLLDQDDTQNSRSYTPTRSSASDSHRLTPFSDSPHSSDDEETSTMKSELRRLREEKFRIRSDSNRQEEKKQWLKEALEKEEREMRAATGFGPVQPAYGSVIPNPMGPTGPTAPPYPHAQYGGANSSIQSQQGTVYHPTVTYNPNQPPTAGYVVASPSAPAQIGETPATAPAPESGESDDSLLCKCVGYLLGFILVALIVVVVAAT